MPHLYPFLMFQNRFLCSGSGYEGWRFSNWQTNRHFNYVSESERDLLTDEMSAEWFEKKIDWIKQNQK